MLKHENNQNKLGPIAEMMTANDTFFDLQDCSRFSQPNAKSCTVVPNFPHTNVVGMVGAFIRAKYQIFRCLLAFLQILVEKP